MIRDDLCLVGLSLEIHSPMSKTFNDCEELLVVDLIIALGRCELPRQVSYRAKLSLVVGLAQTCSDCFV
jgi:hypothetical protein